MRDYQIESLVYKLGLTNLTHTNGKFNFRCPICGDSNSNKRKKRGWILERNSEYWFHCFNCSASMPFSYLLKKHFYFVYKEYVALKLFNTDKPIPEEEIKNVTEIETLKIPNILSLPDDHKAKLYIKNRIIPEQHWNRIYYADKYKEFVNSLLPNKFPDLTNDDDRIVIPIYNIHKKIVGVQGRALNKSKLRYITILFNDNELNSCNLEIVDKNKTIYVTEGFFDSLFLPNAITMNSSNIDYNRLTEIAEKDKFVFVFDNERRNKQIVDRMLKTVNNGFKIALWDKDIKYKDINEMVLNGYKIESILEILERNTCSKLVAKTKILTRFV